MKCRRYPLSVMHGFPPSLPEATKLAVYISSRSLVVTMAFAPLLSSRVSHSVYDLDYLPVHLDSERCSTESIHGHPVHFTSAVHRLLLFRALA
jgi:hypothetical protein